MSKKTGHIVAIFAIFIYLECWWSWCLRVNAGEATDFYPFDFTGPLPVLMVGLAAFFLGVVTPMAWGTQRATPRRWEASSLQAWRVARRRALAG